MNHRWIGFLLLATIGVGSYFWPTLRDRFLGPGDAARVAQEISRQLPALRATVGPVEVSGNEIRVANGKLRLTLSESEAIGPQVGHFHAVAQIAGVQSGSLDACVIGLGELEAERFEDVANSFVTMALPALLSTSRDEALLNATPFWGDEPWAVRGHRGFLGPVTVRGKAELAEFDQAELFSEIPDLPEDGKTHLVKTVLEGRDSVWLRTVEIDGRQSAIDGQPWTRRAPPPGFAMVVRFAVYGQAYSPPPAGGRASAMERLSRHEEWLFPADACPTDVMPGEFPDYSYAPGYCREGRLSQCVDRCAEGFAGDCYNAALELQTSGQLEEETEALFLRACRLGFASGCTNAAAGRGRVSRKNDECALRSFERVCERARDPWACTMLGAALALGDGIEPDAERARRVLGFSCGNGDDDPACEGAKAILGRLDGEHGASDDPR